MGYFEYLFVKKSYALQHMRGHRGYTSSTNLEHKKEFFINFTFDYVEFLNPSQMVKYERKVFSLFTIKE